MSLSRWRMRVEGFYQRRTSALFFRRPFLIETQVPLISFSFDDFPRSALQVGGMILNRYGLAGTYYASLGLMGTETVSGRIFDSTDLALLCDHGHELGCHTFSHCDSWHTKTKLFERSIVENRLALRRALPKTEFRSFSYPISSPRPLTKKRTAKYFLSCRCGGQTFNTGVTDLNLLAAYFLEKTKERIEPVREIINRNRDARGWLIFATHDITANPSPFGCTPEFFEEVVRCAVASGARILPVSEALQSIGAPPVLETSYR